MVVNISAGNVCIDNIGNVPMCWAHLGYCLKKYMFQLKWYNNNDCVTNEIKTSGCFFLFSSLLLKFSLRCEDKHKWTTTTTKNLSGSIEKDSKQLVENGFVSYCLPFLIYLNVNNWTNHAPNTELWAARWKVKKFVIVIWNDFRVVTRFGSKNDYLFIQLLNAEQNSSPRPKTVFVCVQCAWLTISANVISIFEWRFFLFASSIDSQ